MRQSYTPIFQNVLTSRVWALSDAHLRVWLWLRLQADPEGCVCADLAGVAVGARVSAQDARDALEVLAMADADADPADPNEGRLIERVPGGWRVVGLDQMRELARSESQKARNRKYMQRQRAAANDTESPPASTVDSSKSKSKSKSKSLPSEGEIPPTPHDAEIAFADGVDVGYARGVEVSTSVVAPRTIHAIPATWQPSESLRADATMAGVINFDERVASLRSGPIGGVRGVFENAIDDYVRTFFGKWRTWAETDRAKAAIAVKPRGQSYRERPEDTDNTTRAASAFRPSSDHEKYCAKHSLDLAHAVQLYRQSPEHERVGFAESERRFLARLKCWRVTGVFYADGPLPKAKGEVAA